MGGKLDTSRDLTIKALSKLIWRDRKLISVVTLTFVIVASVGALLAPKQYSSSVLVAQVLRNGTAGGGASALLSQFSPLISLTGVSVGGNTEKFANLALLQSRFLTEKFIRENNLLPILYAEKWDVKKGRWKSRNLSDIPTMWKANIEFDKIRTITQNPKTGLITLTITWSDPALAARWAGGLVVMANDYLRQTAITDSLRNIAYLRKQLSSTQLVPVQLALSHLLEIEFQRSMVAGGNKDYAFKVIDPAAVPETPSSTRKIFLVAGGALGGLFVSLLIVLTRSAWRGER